MQQIKITIECVRAGAPPFNAEPIGAPINLIVHYPLPEPSAPGLHVLFLGSHVTPLSVKVMQGAGMVEIDFEVIDYPQDEESGFKSGMSKLFFNAATVMNAREVTIQWLAKGFDGSLKPGPTGHRLDRYSPFHVVLSDQAGVGGSGIHTGASGIVAGALSFFELDP